MTPRVFTSRRSTSRWSAQLRAKLAAAALGGSGARPRAARQPRQAAAARPRRRAARPRQPVPRAGAAGRRRHVRRRVPRRGHDRRHRPGLGPRMHDRRQRRDGEGRHVLPDHGQEAPAGAGDRARRTGCRASTWSTPAARSCRGRTRCSPTATTSAASSTTRRPCRRRGHPADRGRARLVHRRRRLRAGDERRGRDRPQPGHDLPRRPAAGEGRDRRGGHRRGARRRRPALQDLRCHRPSRRRRPRRAADRPAHRRDAGAACRSRRGRSRRRSSRSPTRPSCTTSCPSTRACPTTCTR